MTIYLVAENDITLSELVDRALASDGVIVTRDGKAVVELKAITTAPSSKKPKKKIDLEWLRARRLPLRPDFESPLETLSKLRDEF